MDQTAAINHSFLGRAGAGPAAQAALAIFAISLATLLGAWFFQFVLGYPPCPLCLQQRIPYYIVIPLSLVLALAARGGVSPRLVGAGLFVILAAVVCGAALGTYHAGVEWHFWPGPTACTGSLNNLNSGGSILGQLKSINVVMCDQAAWRFLGISLAGYNVLISLAMAAIALYGLMARRNAA
jgi:disulfide bond formation protein DsbB